MRTRSWFGVRPGAPTFIVAVAVAQEVRATSQTVAPPYHRRVTGAAERLSHTEDAPGGRVCGPLGLSKRKGGEVAERDRPPRHARAHPPQNPSSRGGLPARSEGGYLYPRPRERAAQVEGYLAQTVAAPVGSHQTGPFPRTASTARRRVAASSCAVMGRKAAAAAKAAACSFSKESPRRATSGSQVRA